MIYDFVYPPTHYAYEVAFNALKYVRLTRPQVRIERERAAGSPQVSVVIPTYNYSNVLRCALTSVLWQTFRDFEVLVVGDGCTDDSEQVVASFGDARIRWHNLPANTGNQVQPKNWGMRHARGKYIAHLQHDDVWHPEHLATLVRTIEESQAEWVFGHLANVGPPGSNVRFLTGIYSSGQYEPGHGLSSSSVLHTRELALSIGGLKEASTIWRTPDCDFTLRAWEACGRRFVCSNALTGFKFPASLTKNCYVSKPSFQQEAYVRAIQTGRLFMPREALAILLASQRRLPVHKLEYPDPPSPTPPGWWMEQYRKMRGLGPRPVESAASLQE